ncbi:MAG TPA: YdcF family protein [Ramlibacter sp.]|nr:YdcF family protein [Ramlibacter sp.]
MYEIAKVGGYLLSPLTLFLGLGLLGLLMLLRRRPKWALAFALSGFAGLWVASTPVVAQALIGSLEAPYEALLAPASPSADAIVVLGGALSGAAPPRRPTFNLAPAAGRVWHAAALYRAGKAPWVIVAAGNQPDSQEAQPEAQAIAEMLMALGVPRAAIRLDETSRNTRENAAHALHIAQALKVRRVLLVTSAIHMQRAMKTFTQAWGRQLVLVAAPTDFWLVKTQFGPKMWIPTESGLGNVTNALKEYAGLLALDII